MNITTIVAIVAFVSLLIIFVVVISSWRQGNKARNATIKAIEQSINDVVYELSEMNTTWKTTYERIDFERKKEEESRAAEIEKLIEKQVQAKESEPIPVQVPVQTPGEISLDFADLEDFDSLSLDDIELLDSMSDMHTDYNTGRSGKKYTAEELESLIKE